MDDKTAKHILEHYGIDMDGYNPETGIYKTWYKVPYRVKFVKESELPIKNSGASTSYLKRKIIVNNEYRPIPFFYHEKIHVDMYPISSIARSETALIAGIGLYEILGYPSDPIGIITIILGSRLASHLIDFVDEHVTRSIEYEKFVPQVPDENFEGIAQYIPWGWLALRLAERKERRLAKLQSRNTV
ncbi:MAG TPA: hypothetical protein VJH34_02250 [archaeon]|nr:hypothetical protein [archaeon]